MINPVNKLLKHLTKMHLHFLIFFQLTLNTTSLAFCSAFLHFASILSPCSLLLKARSSFESSVPCLTAPTSEEDLRASGSPNTGWLSKSSDCSRIPHQSPYLCMHALLHCGVIQVFNNSSVCLLKFVRPDLCLCHLDPATQPHCSCGIKVSYQVVIK